jgi:Carboxypeptidase regulatory-like domain
MSDQTRRNRIGIAIVFALAGLVLLVWPRARTAPPRPAVDAAPRAAVQAPVAPRPIAPAPPGPSAALRAQPVVPIPAQVEKAQGPATFEGKVVSLTTGFGVGGAEVTFERGGTAFVSRADDSGAFRFVAEGDGEWTLAAVTADGFHPFAPEWGHSPISLIARRGLRVTGLTFTLVPSLFYGGRVVSPDGKAVEGADVEVVGAGTGESALMAGPSRWTTDAEGRFTFSARDGDWLAASHPRFGRGEARLDYEAQVRGELVIALDRALGAPRGAITGRVVDSGGQPVPGALVFLSEGRAFSYQPEDSQRERVKPDQEGPVERAAQTRGDGTFRFEGLDGERYVVSARSKGLAPASKWASQGDSVTLTLEKGGRISGVVREGRGQAVPAFTVVVREATSALARETFASQAFVAPDGRFELTGIPDGQYALVAGAVGYAPSAEVPADVRKRGEAKVELRLSKGGAAVGKVTRREDHGPLAQARVAVEGNWGEGASAVPLVAEARTAADGTFKLSGLAAGTRSILVTAAGRHGRILSGLRIREGETLGSLEIDLAALDGGTPQLELVGIGAVLATVAAMELRDPDGGLVGKQEDALVIREVLAGGGAFEAGLAGGDQIDEIDGKRVVELGFGPSIEAIRGVEGTVVRLQVRSREEGGLRTVEVRRRRIMK